MVQRPGPLQHGSERIGAEQRHHGAVVRIAPDTIDLTLLDRHLPAERHVDVVSAVIDVTLGRYATVWAAAGHSHSVFATTYDELIRITGGQPMDVA